MQWLLAIILIHAPWHDAYTLGQRGPLPGAFAAFGTWAGLANLVIFGLLTFFSISTILSKKISWPSFGLCLSPFIYCLLNRGDLNKATIQSLMGISSLGLLLCSAQVGNFIDKKKFQTLFFIFFISYSLALLLPFLFRFPGYRIFQLFYTTLRYRGWVGEGQPIGFCGMTLTIWGSIFFLSETEHLKKRWWGIAAILVGASGILLNVLRIALLGTSIFFFLILYQGLIKQAKTQFKLGAWGLILCSLLFSTPQIRNKNKTGYREETGNYRVATVAELPSFLQAFVQNGFAEITQVEKVVVTNGRAATYKMIHSHFKGHKIFGLGTGSVRRILDQTYTNHGELASDHLRILFEEGVLGFIIFLIPILRIAWIFRNTLFMPVLGTYFTALATDMFMVMPAMGFGPLLILVCFAPALLVKPQSRSKTELIRKLVPV